MPRVGQIVAALAGLFFGVIGAATLVDTGLSRLGDHTAVLGLHHTTLLGLIELIYGLLLLGSAFSWSVHAAVSFLGILGAGFGLVILITGRALHDSLGVHQENGWLFTIVGALIALAGFLAGRAEGPYPAEGGSGPPGEPRI